jgi:hypothetical protein
MTADVEAWTTRQVAEYLGITRGKVADTMRRWGVKAVPHGVTSGSRGFSRAYSATEVVEADRNRPGKRRAEKAVEEPAARVAKSPKD